MTLEEYKTAVIAVLNARPGILCRDQRMVAGALINKCADEHGVMEPWMVAIIESFVDKAFDNARADA